MPVNEARRFLQAIMSAQVWHYHLHFAPFNTSSGIPLSGEQAEIVMLWTIVAVLLILWLLGFSLHVAGGLIHLLLVAALVMIVINLISARQGTARGSLAS